MSSWRPAADPATAAADAAAADAAANAAEDAAAATTATTAEMARDRAAYGRRRPRKCGRRFPRARPTDLGGDGGAMGPPQWAERRRLLLAFW